MRIRTKGLQAAVALGLALMLFCISGCNLLVKNTERDMAVVVATVEEPNGNVIEITRAELESFLDTQLTSMSVTPSEVRTDPDMVDSLNSFRLTTLDTLVEQKILEKKAEELGLTLSEEEQAGIDGLAESYTQQLWDDLYTQVKAEDTYNEKSEEQINEEVQSRYDSLNQGVTTATISASMSLTQLSERLVSRVKSGVTVPDEAVVARYNELVEKHKATYTADPSAYEKAMNNYDYSCWQPAGFIRAKHILLQISDIEQNTIDAYSELGDTAGAEKATEMAMDTVEMKAQAILKMIQGGVSFDEMVEEYNTDSGMRDPIVKRRGYVLSKDSSMAPEFVTTAFSLKNVGDISDPVRSSLGVHIIQLSEIIAEGPTPIEEVWNDIYEELLVEYKNKAWDDQVDAWKSEYKIETFPDRAIVEEAEKAE